MSWDETIKGTSGSDVISGGSGDDYLQGRAGADILDGGDGDDQLHGDAGDDFLRGGAGNDLLHGGLGTDSAVYSGSILHYSFSRKGEEMFVNHSGGSMVDGYDRLISIERLVFADAVIDLTQNNAPIAFGDSASTDEDVGTYSGSSVLANDFDWEGSSLTATPGTFNGVYGTLTMNANGTYTYTPYASTQSLALGQTVTDSFTYTVSDGSLSGTGTLTISVAGRNDAPVANPDVAATGENSPVSIDVLANDTDIDNGAALTVTAASAPSGQGSASVVANQVVFDPGTDFDHLDTGESAEVVLSYTITDEHGTTSTSTVTVTVNGANDAPVANDDSASTSEDGGASGNVLANDTDVDGETLTVTNPGTYVGAYGTLVLAADGSYTYSPNAAAQGLDDGEVVSDSFVYTASDGTASDTATLTVTVAGANDAPTSNDDSAATTEDGTASGNVLANDTDVDGETLTVTNAGTYVGTYGTLILAADGSYTYTPNAAANALAAGETAQDAFAYAASDGTASDTATLTVAVAGANDAPTIDSGGTDASGSVAELADGDAGENVAVHLDSGTIAFDDVDLSDTHSASVSAQGGGYLGTFTLDPVNQGSDTLAWHFEVGDAALDGLEEGETVTQTYTITIDDGHGGTVSQNVTITLTGASDTATWYIDNSAVGSTNEGTQANPFTSIAAFNAAQGTAGGPAEGATVYLLYGTGTYAEADGINLLDGQILVGVPSILGDPTIAPTAGDGVNVGHNNSISGIDIASGSGDGIADSGGSVGALTVSDVDITTTSGNGIEIDDGGAGVSISGTTIATGSGYAILGADLAGFSLTDSTVSSGGASSGTISLTEVTGTVDFLGNVLNGGGGDTLSIANSAGSAVVTIADSATRQAVVGTNDAANGDDGVSIVTSGSASLTLTVDGVEFEGAQSDLLEVRAEGNSTQDLTIAGNSFHNTQAGTGGGVFLTGGGAGSDISVVYSVEDNSFTGANGSALTAAYNQQAGDVTGSIANNEIGIDDGNATAQGSAGGSGIVVILDKHAGSGTATYEVSIVGNNIADIDSFDSAIYLRSNGDGTANSAILEATVTGNTISEMGDYTFAGLYAIVGGSAFAGDFAELGLVLEDNAIDMGDADYGLSAVYLDQLSGDAHYYFPGYAGSPDGEYMGGTASADLQAFFEASGNTFVSPPYPSGPGPVDAQILLGATGDAFLL
jgi:VCBS repeat-containing protein